MTDETGFKLVVIIYCAIHKNEFITIMGHIFQ